MKQRAKPRDSLPGRHCWVCGKIGGAGFTRMLQLLGYDVKPGEMAHAHPECIRREQKRMRRATDR